MHSSLEYPLDESIRKSAATEQRQKLSHPIDKPESRDFGCDDGNSSDFNSEISVQEEDADEDILTVRVDPEKTWITLEDEDIERIERLAQCIRCDPLLPPPLHGVAPRFATDVEGLGFRVAALSQA